MTTQAPPRVALVGDGTAGLTCAQMLCLRSCDPLIIEADNRHCNRCNSRSTLIGMFDAEAECMSGATRQAAHVVQRPGKLSAIHPWAVLVTPAEDVRNDSDWEKNLDEADITRTLNLMGVVCAYWARTHPALVVSVVVVVAVVRPRATWRWTLRVWSAWKIVRRSTISEAAFRL